MTGLSGTRRSAARGGGRGSSRGHGLLAGAVLAATLAACKSTAYGSRLWPVELNTRPEGCDGWIVPNTSWVFERDTILADRALALAAYPHFVTPWTVHAPPYVHVFVAIRGEGEEAELLYQEFTPSRDGMVLLGFEPPEPEPLPEEEPTPDPASAEAGSG